MISNNIAALILAGGQSSRMGQDKALVTFEGQPLLQRMSQVAATCCQPIYILTPWPERYQAIVSENVQFLFESHPGQGPLVALVDGLTQIQAEWVLLLACDLPLLQPTLLQAWVSQLTDIQDFVLAVVPRQPSGWEPLCGFYRQTTLKPLQQFIQQGGRSFQTGLTQIPVQPLEVNQSVAQMLFNCNTPDDLKALSQEKD